MVSLWKATDLWTAIALIRLHVYESAGRSELFMEAHITEQAYCMTRISHYGHQQAKEDSDFKCPKFSQI